MSTGLGLLIVLGLALALEFYAIANRKPHDTISEVVWRTVYRQPFIAFLSGYLCGHLFWQAEQCRELLMGALR